MLGWGSRRRDAIYAAILFILASPTHDILCQGAKQKVEGAKVLGTEEKKRNKHNPSEASGRQCLCYLD